MRRILVLIALLLAAQAHAAAEFGKVRSPKILIFRGDSPVNSQMLPRAGSPPTPLSPALLRQALYGDAPSSSSGAIIVQSPAGLPDPLPYLTLSARSAFQDRGYLEAKNAAWSTSNNHIIINDRGWVTLSLHPAAPGKRYLIDWAVWAPEADASAPIYTVSGPGGSPQRCEPGKGSQHVIALYESGNSGEAFFSLSASSPLFDLYSVTVTELPRAPLTQSESS